MFFDLEPLLWLNCARHSVTGQTPRKIPAFQGSSSRLHCLGFGPSTTLRDRTLGNGYAALPIGARLYLHSLTTKRPFLTNLCLHIQKANISLCRPCHKCTKNRPCLPHQDIRQHVSLPCCPQKRKAFPPSATP